MTRFSKAEQQLLAPAVSFLCDVSQEALHLQMLRGQESNANASSSHQSELGEGEENKYSLLRDYDTVFLVDDSRSMVDGGRWQLVQKILARSTDITTKYDPDGIDIHFFNNKRASADNIKDREKARSILQSVRLDDGRTPTLQRLSDHLSGYMRRFHAKRDAFDFQKYNLIILTDGEPDPSFEYDGEVSDEDDAKKNTAVNRKIRKTIVKAGRELDEADASEKQIGIQFCRIGNDPEVAKFFNYLDDNLRKKYAVRDVYKLLFLVWISHANNSRWWIQSTASTSAI